MNFKEDQGPSGPAQCVGYHVVYQNWLRISVPDGPPNATTCPNMNPYAPPATAGAKIEHRSGIGSPAIAAVSAICALAFIVFTIVLLRSTSSDRKAGMMFLANAPVLVLVATSAIGSTRKPAYFAFAAAGIQVVITIAMLVMSIGDAQLVIGINLMIIVPCLAIAVWAWRSDRRHALAISSSQTGG